MEEKAIYKTPTLSSDNNGSAMAQSFTLYMEQIGKLSDLQQRTGLKRSELVRKAIDLLYQRINEIEVES